MKWFLIKQVIACLAQRLPSRFNSLQTNSYLRAR